MFLKNDSGDVFAVGTPDGSVEPDSEGVFQVPDATGHALLKMAGWTEVGPEASTEGKAAAEAAAAAEEEAAQAAAAAEAKAAKAAAAKAAKAAAAETPAE